MSAPTELFADLNSSGSVVSARLKGPSIGEREGEIVRGQIAAHLEQAGSARHLVLDFADVSYVNSAGLGALIAMQTEAKKHGARVVLHRLPPAILDILRVTRLHRVFTIAKDDKHLAKLVR